MGQGTDLLGILYKLANDLRLEVYGPSYIGTSCGPWVCGQPYLRTSCGPWVCGQPYVRTSCGPWVCGQPYLRTSRLKAT